MQWKDPFLPHPSRGEIIKVRRSEQKQDQARNNFSPANVRESGRGMFVATAPHVRLLPRQQQQTFSPLHLIPPKGCNDFSLVRGERFFPLDASLF